MIDHYASGGSEHKNQSEHIKGFSISVEEKKAVISFLESLSGKTAREPLNDIVSN